MRVREGRGYERSIRLVRERRGVQESQQGDKERVSVHRADSIQLNSIQFASRRGSRDEVYSIYALARYILFLSIERTKTARINRY